jgi:hypothetical protein
VKARKRIEELLDKEPKLPRPSIEEMKKMLHTKGEWVELIPYFKKEVGEVRSYTGARLRILNAVDPDAYASRQAKAKESLLKSGYLRYLDDGRGKIIQNGV